MKQVVKGLVLAGTMAVAGSVGADMFGDFIPYIGADYYQAWMKPDKFYKGELPKSYPGATIYIGNKFTENFGVELGFDYSGTKKKMSTTTETGNVGGVAANATVTETAKVSRRGAHLDLVGFLPINECINLFGSVGYGWVKPKISIQNVTVANVAGIPIPTITEQDTLKGKANSVFRLGAGAEWMMTDMFGLRGKVGWETTSALYGTNEADDPKVKVFKDSVTVAVGAFVRF